MTQAATNWIKARKVLIKNGDFRHLFDGIDRTTSADVVKMLDDAGIKWLNFDYVPQGSYFSSPIKSFAVPAGVTHIFESAFEGSSLEKIDLPDGLSYIGTLAFSRTHLKSISIPHSINFIGQVAITNTDIESLNIQASTSLDIQNAAFYANRKLKEVCIEGDTLFYVGSEAFSHCSLLKKVTIGSKLKFLGKAAFHSCPLEEIEFKGTKAKWLRSVSNSWNMGASVRIVRCSDGELSYSDGTY